MIMAAQKEKIVTKKDEIRFFTSDPKQMLNKWMPEGLKRTWTEDFIDEDTQETVSVERNEVLFERGTLIDQDILAKINFYIQAGEIKEVEVSNQKRLAFESKNNALYPWQATAQIKDKKYKFLLYGTSITNVVEILKDYIELNFSSGFQIIMAKEMERCIILVDNFAKQKVDIDKAYLKEEISLEEYIEAKDRGAEEDEKIEEKKFYQLEIKITYSDDTETTTQFIVNTYDTERALMVISHYLKKWEEERQKEHEEKGWSKYEIRDFKLSIEKAAPIPVGAFVPKDFSLAYNGPEN